MNMKGHIQKRPPPPPLLTTKEKRNLRNRYFHLRSKEGFGSVNDLLPFVRGKTSTIRRAKLKRWLLSQTSYAVHHPVIKKYKRQSINITGIHEQWEADLMFLTMRKKSKPILTVIDSFSKRGDIRVLKNKSPSSIVEAFKDILKN